MMLGCEAHGREFDNLSPLFGLPQQARIAFLFGGEQFVPFFVSSATGRKESDEIISHRAN